jgi:hypothetical protein
MRGETRKTSENPEVYPPRCTQGFFAKLEEVAARM